MRRNFVALLVLAALVASSCADHTNHSQSGTSPESTGVGEVPGRPAAAADADREIRVTANDDLTFKPGSIEVSASETVTFVVVNKGQTDHEFVIGDETYQEMHDSDMQQNDHMMHMTNAVDVAPGEMGEITWQFDEAGEVLFACHEPGHFDGGMIGSIQVT